MTIETKHRYIARDDGILSGEPIIHGTRIPVRAIVELWRLGVTPEEIPTHLPHLTLAQIFDALSYYADHQAEIQSYLDRNAIPDDLAHPAVRANPECLSHRCIWMKTSQSSLLLFCGRVDLTP